MPRREWLLGALAVTTGCGRLGFDPTATADAGSDGNHASADAALGAWGPPVLIPGVNSASNDWGPALAPDALTLYFHSDRTGDDDIYRSTRPSRDVGFGPAAVVASLAVSGANDKDPTLSRGGTRMYLASSRSGVEDRIYVSDLVGGSFSTPVEVTELGPSWGPAIVADDLELIYTLAGGLARAVRQIDTDPWSPGGLIAELAPPGGSTDGYGSLSSDGLTIYFESTRGASGMGEVYVATRPDRGSAFSIPIPFAPANLAGTGSSDPEISSDGREMVIGSDRGGAGANDLYLLTRGQ